MVASDNDMTYVTISEKDFTNKYVDSIDDMVDDFVGRVCERFGCDYKPESGYDDDIVPAIRERLFEALYNRGFDVRGDGSDF